VPSPSLLPVRHTRGESARDTIDDVACSLTLINSRTILLKIVIQGSARGSNRATFHADAATSGTTSGNNYKELRILPTRLRSSAWISPPSAPLIVLIYIYCELYGEPKNCRIQYRSNQKNTSYRDLRQVSLYIAIVTSPVTSK